jgi:hypothetical protein
VSKPVRQNEVLRTASFATKKKIAFMPYGTGMSDVKEKKIVKNN